MLVINNKSKKYHRNYKLHTLFFIILLLYMFLYNTFVNWFLIGFYCSNFSRSHFYTHSHPSSLTFTFPTPPLHRFLLFNLPVSHHSPHPHYQSANTTIIFSSQANRPETKCLEIAVFFMYFQILYSKWKPGMANISCKKFVFFSS